MLNKVMIIGRLGRDPELRYMSGGDPVANLNIATDESYTDRDGNKVDRTEWHKVVVFRRAAENCANFLSKGSLVYVEGKLQTRKWQDPQGQDRYTTEINAQRIQFLDRKGERGADDGGYGGRSDFDQASADAGRGFKGQQRNKPQQERRPSSMPDYPPEGSETGMDEVPF